MMDAGVPVTGGRPMELYERFSGAEWRMNISSFSPTLRFSPESKLNSPFYFGSYDSRHSNRQKYLEMRKRSTMECRRAETESAACAAIPPPTRNGETMKKILIGLCALSLCAGLVPKIWAQTVTVTVGPTTDDSYWIWNDEYQVWVWNGPEFEGDYQGHPYSYWHGRHEGGGDRNHRPGKGESSRGLSLTDQKSHRLRRR